MRQPDFSGVIQVLDHLKIFLFAVFQNNFMATFRIEEMFQHPFGISFRMKLHPENFFRKANRHQGAFQCNVWAQFFQSDNFSAHVFKPGLIRLRHLKIPEVCYIKWIF